MNRFGLFIEQRMPGRGGPYLLVHIPWTAGRVGFMRLGRRR